MSSARPPCLLGVPAEGVSGIRCYVAGFYTVLRLTSTQHVFSPDFSRSAVERRVQKLSKTETARAGNAQRTEAQAGDRRPRYRRFIEVKFYIRMNDTMVVMVSKRTVKLTFSCLFFGPPQYSAVCLGKTILQSGRRPQANDKMDPNEENNRDGRDVR